LEGDRRVKGPDKKSRRLMTTHYYRRGSKTGGRQWAKGKKGKKDTRDVGKEKDVPDDEMEASISSSTRETKARGGMGGSQGDTILPQRGESGREKNGSRKAQKQ